MANNRAVFITGAAKGIGRATALAFAREGYTVGGYDIDEDGLRSLAAEIEALGATAHTGHLDVTDTDEMATRVSEFAALAGNRLDVFINNAGILNAGRFEDIDVRAHFAEIDINTKGVVNGLHAAFPYLRSTPGSTVVNLASASAIYGQPELAVYSATKFFIRGLTEALELEWGRYGIRVLSMWPLFVRTAMTDDLHTGSTRSLGIRLTADDVAAAIVSAVHERSRLRRLAHQVHYPVGTQTTVLANLAKFSPAWAARLLNKLLTRA
ncbi:SDR family oxidoreductase [uncultured Mycolicibacterium sp.]|jgi:Short-chain dehydrogenases of various substrate specificities|uniref:SDR family oxidoreductase n=1 Tax=uncultured Mycolicibacterium sp. TaxID=2320817 RepID=UPI0026024542|nr:SDR family oxidoreductase [uncultured Mycolicibacterium sp.]